MHRACRSLHNVLCIYIYYDFQVSVFMGALCVLMRESLILLLSLGLFFCCCCWCATCQAPRCFCLILFYKTASNQISKRGKEMNTQFSKEEQITDKFMRINLLSHQRNVIKTILGFQLTPVRIAIIKKTHNRC